MSPLDPGGKRSCLGIYSIGAICSLWTPHKKISSLETIEALHKGTSHFVSTQKVLATYTTSLKKKRKLVAEHVPLQDNLSPCLLIVFSVFVHTCWRVILRDIEHGEMTGWLVPSHPPPLTHGSEKAWKPMEAKVPRRTRRGCMRCMVSMSS